MAISADGTRVVVGMPGVSGPCGIHTNIANVAPFVRVYQFEVASLSWEKLGSDMTIEPSTENGHCYGYYFGYSVDMADDGSLIAIRADKFAFDAAKSRVHLYSLDADTNDWVKAGGDILDDAIDDTAISGSYGTPTDVSLSGDGKYVAIGAHLNDNVMTDGGSVRVYKDPSAAGTITCVTERLVLLLPRHRRHGHHVRRVHHPHVHVQRHVRGHRLNADRGGCAGRWRRRRWYRRGYYKLWGRRRWRRGGLFCQRDDCLEEGLQPHSRRRWKRRNCPQFLHFSHKRR